MDDFLRERLEKYDRWLDDGKISFSSRIIPVNKSLEAQQWVLPSEQAEEILRSARTLALQECACRVHYSRCDKPREVCLLLNEYGGHAVARGRARPVSMAEAAEVLRKADEHGLVHLTLYQPDHEIFALCSCCPCCCHDLQLMRQYGRRDLVVRSEYIAVTDGERCSHCGTCADRCVFGARTFDDGRMSYDPGSCLGCGLCVTVCPDHAIVMRMRDAQTRGL
jgi:ferredoxin